MLGYYIEFERKSVAKRVALTLNLQPIKNNDSRLLQIKYIANFEWTEIEEEEDRKKLRKNLLLAEAEKELRELKMYENYKKWSDKIKKTKKTPESLKGFHFPQKKFKSYERSDDVHLRFLPVSFNLILTFFRSLNNKNLNKHLSFFLFVIFKSYLEKNFNPIKITRI